MERNEAIAVNYPSSLSLSSLLSLFPPPSLSLPPLSFFPPSLFLTPSLFLSLSLYPSFSLLEYHIDGQFLTKVTPNFIGKNRKELKKKLTIQLFFKDEKLHITNTADRSILLRSISDLRLHQLSTTLPRLPVNEYDNTTLLSPPPSGNDTTRTARGGAHGKSKSFDELLNVRIVPYNVYMYTRTCACVHVCVHVSVQSGLYKSIF